MIFGKYFRRIRASERGVPFYIDNFYIYTAWWTIEKNPKAWGWPEGVEFTNADVQALYQARVGEVLAIARVGKLVHDYKLMGINSIPGDDHLPGGSLGFRLEYWRTQERT